MPSKFVICFPKYIHLLNGKKIFVGEECFEIPIYIEIEKIPVPRPPWKTFDPRERYLAALVGTFDGASVGPNLRDLATTLSVLHTLDAVENTDLRVRLQEVVVESARELASAAIPDADFQFELDMTEHHPAAAE